ncbi:MAG: 1,2-phenylacetyl-CoA epoxidase subunit PaaC [Gemmatimonadales bacterium]
MTTPPLFELLLRLGDDRLVLGHRTSEWCGHGPILEEDIALTNVSLDLIGQAQLFLDLAGSVEGKGRDADALAYWRDEIGFRNLQLLELPPGDFGFTMMRQFLFSAWSHGYLAGLMQAENEDLAGIAAKAAKENRYHLRHAAEWVIRLGDGTEESHGRVEAALTELWPWTVEFYHWDEVDEALASSCHLPSVEEQRAGFEKIANETFARAGLTVPEGPGRMAGGRRGRHTEHLGHMLAEMQIVARSHPGATW